MPLRCDDYRQQLSFNPSHGNGYDIEKEIRQLGNELICEVHVKDKSGKIFGEGEVDFEGALQALEEIGYDRWYVLEGQKVGG